MALNTFSDSSNGFEEPRSFSDPPRENYVKEDESYELLDGCIDDVASFMNELAGIQNIDFRISQPHIFYDLLVSMLTAPCRYFNSIYGDIIERVLSEGNTDVITEDFLPLYLKDKLTIIYNNDWEKALQKFDVFAHLMFCEEILRVATPLFEKLKPVNVGENETNGTVEFELSSSQIPEVMTHNLIFCADETMYSGELHAYEGAFKINGSSLKLRCKMRSNRIKIDPDKTYTFYEKPFENTFENWQHMIQTFRNDRTISRKAFGPFDLTTPIVQFLEMRESKKGTILDMVENFFNDEQKDAIFSMLFQENKYAFVLFGPPGTGKTTTLVEAIRVIIQNPCMLACGKHRFLVCTPSNSAADAFALALMKRNFLPKNAIFRAISSRYDDETRDPRIDDITMKDDRGIYSVHANNIGFEGYQVVISTIGFCPNLKVAGKNFFSHIIIDEAGQCLEPETFIPLSYFANENTNVILAGDPHQLGPVVTSNFLNDERFGMTSSLVRLSQQLDYRTDDRLMVQLKNNHRSHKFIVDMASFLFYNNTLRSTFPSGHDSLCESPILGGSKIPVRFVCVYGQEVDATPSYYNVAEIEAVESYVKECLKPQYNLNPADIGIVCPYRENVRRLQARFKRYPRMTIDTVERFQGSERRVIIMTTVRTNRLGFLNEYRRFNTAITRAKHMLIVIGNPGILLQDETWKIFLCRLYFSDCFYPSTDDPETLKYWHNYFTSIRSTCFV